MLDYYLTNRAQDAARRSARLGKWIYSDTSSTGVNYATISDKLSPLLINKWYKESKNCNYNTLFERSKFMHFTNLVWKHTLAVGIGITQKNSELYVCVKFFPEGVKKKVHFGDEQVRTFHSGDPPIKVAERDIYVRYGGKEIKTFNPEHPPNRFNNDKSFWYRYIFRRHQHGQKYHGFRVEKLLKRYSLSSKIWYHVWGRCKRVDCYSKYNFARVYGMFFKEINLYRKLHKSVPLRYDHKLAKEALQEATKSAKARTLINVKKYRYSTLYIIYNVLYVPITIYKWYREISMYDFKANVVIPQAEHFSILVWRNTTRIGIGIAKNENDVYMVFKFYPEGNQNYRFKENVHKPAYNRFNFKM